MKVEDMAVLLDEYPDETQIMETTIREMAGLSSALIDYIQAYKRNGNFEPGDAYWERVIGRCKTMYRDFYIMINYLGIDEEVEGGAESSIKKSIRKILRRLEE